jgi:uncharacterized membrane protein
MKPLLVLLITFAVSLFVLRIMKGDYQFAFSARIAMAVMLVFTAIGHVALTQGMSMMLPDFVPFKTEVVYLTGVIEIAAAIGLFIPSLRVTVGWLLIMFFLLVLPANIYAAWKHVDYQKGTFEGQGLTYLWFRVPLQILFIIWTYFAAVKHDP